jgi:hypothetical protein
MMRFLPLPLPPGRTRRRKCNVRARGIAADNIRHCNRAASLLCLMQQRNVRLALRNIVNSKCCSDPKAPCSPTCAAALKAYEDNPYHPVARACLFAWGARASACVCVCVSARACCGCVCALLRTLCVLERLS